MKSYPRPRKRIFNGRLSRARKYIEYAFGNLNKKFRIIDTSIQIIRDTASGIKRSCILHNFMRQYDGHCYLGCNNIGEKTQNINLNIRTSVRNNRALNRAEKIRNAVKQHFVNAKTNISNENNIPNSHFPLRIFMIYLVKNILTRYS